MKKGTFSTVLHMDSINLILWTVILVLSITRGSTNSTTSLSTATSNQSTTITSLTTTISNPSTAISPTYSPGTTSGSERTVGLTQSSTTATNSSGNSTAENGSAPPGKSWNFIFGVVAVVLTTSFLILVAVKFPKWYNYLASYNHHRLQEYQPDIFDQEFDTDMSSVPQTTPSMVDDDDCTVVFEQLNTFVTDDDGFIEDKYIDAQVLTEET